MTPYLVERLVELRRHLDHLVELRPRVRVKEDLARDLSLHNDVLFEYVALDPQRAVDALNETRARGAVPRDRRADATSRPVD